MQNQFHLAFSLHSSQTIWNILRMSTESIIHAPKVLYLSKIDISFVKTSFLQS